MSKNFYVSPLGLDTNAGTKSKPFKTLGKGVSALSVGDSLFLKKGSTFKETLALNTSGIRVSSYGAGALPIVQLGVKINGSSIVVDNITSANSTIGFHIAGSGNELNQVEAYGNMHGVEINPGANSNKVLKSYLHHNQKMQPNTPGPWDDYGAVGVVVQGDNCEVAYNTITDHVATSADFGTDGSAVEIYGGIGTLVHHNTALNNRTFTELGHKRAANTVYAFNNVLSVLQDSEFLITRGEEDANFGPVKNTSAIGNSVNLTGDRSTGFVVYAGTQTALLALYQNDFIVKGNVGSAPAGTVVGGNNTYHGPVNFKMLPGDRQV